MVEPFKHPAKVLTLINIPKWGPFIYLYNKTRKDIIILFIIYFFLESAEKKYYRSMERRFLFFSYNLLLEK